MYSKYLTIVLLITSFPLFSQATHSDTQLIITTIENYFNGYIERDSHQLNKAFDTQNGTMKVPTKTKDGKVNFENKYFSDIIPKWSSRERLSPSILDNCSLEILNVDIIEGRMSTAKINMKVDNTTYLDVLSLQKINQEWKITNKMYVILGDK